MTVLVSDVEASRPEGLSIAADRIADDSGRLSGIIAQQRQQLAELRQSWQGTAADAATARGEHDLARQEQFRDRLQALSDALPDGGAQLASVRGAVMQVVDDLRRSGWQVSDDGVATAPPFFPLPIRAMAPAFTSIIQKLLAQFSAVDLATANAISAAGGFKQSPTKPDIPDPPADPPVDEGQAEHGSQPWYSRADDYAFKEVAEAAATAADLRGWDNAARHLQHYLDNSGADLNVDVDDVLHDLPGAQRQTDALVNAEVARIVEEAAATGNYGQPIPFQTGWHDYTVDQATHPDWFYAMGSFEQSVSGVVTVHPPTTPGGKPTVTVEYKTHIFDRYNWDNGKSVEIGGVTITDQQMGELHTAGLAQEYNVRGSSTTYTYTGVAPTATAPVALPPAVPGERVPR
ncbi:WXG100 family type VII secretion target [Mycobacterium hubeiense]|uniref:WXG100 family type VII secretion target n=1 Tax=Mycobacterium hubeiense TaxID=1867256 RepID=UPI000C7F0E52|nr:WXG100 family type VII secretion target [Mycobacterium sp. QGD 101]